jgi:Flp pilus assembly protein TadD
MAGMSRRFQSSSNEELSREATLLRRARKHVVRGESRQAMLALREATFAASNDARLWARYGVQCWRLRKHEEAADALRQAIWLREREQNDGPARVLRGLLVAIEEGRAAGSDRAA